MTQPTHPQLLARFADAIERTGIESVSASLLTELVEAARRADASPVVLAVLTDPTEPSVVRERAFVKVASRIIGNDRDSATATAAHTPAVVDRQPALLAS